MTHLGSTRTASLIATALLVLTTACASTSPPLERPITEPVIDQPGENLVRYRGPQLEVVISTRYAATRVGEEWMILQVGMGGMQSASTEVRRDAISLQIPEGQRIPIMSHQLFSSQYSEIAGPARQAAIAAEPLDISRSERRDCALGFMPLPGTSVVREAQQLNMRELCQGFLYFRIPGGIQPGQYELRVELEERTVDVPFEIR